MATRKRRTTEAASPPGLIDLVAEVAKAASAAAGQTAQPSRPGLFTVLAETARAGLAFAAEEHDYVVGDCPILHDRPLAYQPGELIRLTRAAAARLGRAVTIQSQG